MKIFFNSLNKNRDFKYYMIFSIFNYLACQIILKSTYQKFMKIIKFFILTVLILSNTSCLDLKQESFKINGKTMGTYYIVNVVDPPKNVSKKKLKVEVSKTLEEINKKLSNWDNSSEVSFLNQNKTLLPVIISEDLFNVINASNLIHIKSEGFFDITIDPLIELWGFGYRNKKKKVPSQIEIKNALKLVNQSKVLQLNPENLSITKSNKDVSINLSSIAKGYGIDLIGQKLEKLGIENYLIDIGGDILTKGKNKVDKDWVIGIENPNLIKRLIKEIVNITDKGIATSGDYKNFYEENGVQYSHILNPNSGKPIIHNTKSVTIIHDNAMMADGWATALLALGSIKGLEIAEKNEIASLFIIKEKNNFIKIKSSEFKKLSKSNN